VVIDRIPHTSTSVDLFHTYFPTPYVQRFSVWHPVHSDIFFPISWESSPLHRPLVRSLRVCFFPVSFLILLIILDTVNRLPILLYPTDLLPRPRPEIRSFQHGGVQREFRRSVGTSSTRSGGDCCSQSQTPCVGEETFNGPSTSIAQVVVREMCEECGEEAGYKCIGVRSLRRGVRCGGKERVGMEW